jgi:hypothetical protein
VFCPKCKAEYVPGRTMCSDCGLELVDALPERRPKKRRHHRPAKPPDPAPPYSLSDEPADLVTILATGDSGMMAIARSLLQSAQIPFVVMNEAAQDVIGIGRIVGYNPITGPMQLLVRAPDAADAELILQDLGGRRNALYEDHGHS